MTPASAVTPGAPGWSLGAFHARVRMAKDFHLFVVAEGNVTDPQFYDELARTSRRRFVRAVKVYCVEQVTRGQPGGPGLSGKNAVIAAYASSKAGGSLSFMNRGGRRSILFCVDRDLDQRHVPYESDRHFCVTQQRDVEAEIFINANHVLALKRLLSVDSADAKFIWQHNSDWLVSLARMWSDWILLSSVVAISPSAPPGNWADKSPINIPPYSATVDATQLGAIESRLVTALGSKNKLRLAKQAARAHLRGIRSAHGKTAVLKGKWLPAYLAELLGTSESRKRAIRGGALMAFAGALMFDGAWADHFRDKMGGVFARGAGK